MQHRLTLAVLIAVACPQVSIADVTDATCVQARVGGAPGTILVPQGLDATEFCSGLVPAQIDQGVCREAAAGSGSVCETPRVVLVRGVPLWKLEPRSDARGSFCVPSYQTSLRIDVKVGDGCLTVTR